MQSIKEMYMKNDTDKKKYFNNSFLSRTDIRLTKWMARNALSYMRISMGIIFLWYGFLKFFPQLSSAEQIATKTISVLTFNMVPDRLILIVLALWEVAIGVGLIFRIFLRETLLLMFLQMLGTLTPLILFPAETFTVFPLVPTLLGQYIIKNLVIITAGLAIGATARGGKLTAD